MSAVPQKMAAAAIVRELGFAFSINVVLHRANLDRVGEIIELAASLGADRLELANTQYYGWALENRRALMPTRGAGRGGRGRRRRRDARATRAGCRSCTCCPTTTSRTPKPCYGGWGKFYLVVMPDGRTLPCHGATHITTLTFDSVRDRSLRWIWEESPAFQAFRGDDWMQEPCRSCPRKAIDFGGCRCQAFALTGDATQRRPGLHADAGARASSTRPIGEADGARLPLPLHRACRGPQRTIAAERGMSARRPRSRPSGSGATTDDACARRARSRRRSAARMVGLLGPNGAGKTTAMLLLATLLTPSRGAARIFGHDVVARPRRDPAAPGLVFQEAEHRWPVDRPREPPIRRRADGPRRSRGAGGGRRTRIERTGLTSQASRRRGSCRAAGAGSPTSPAPRCTGPTC